MRLTPWAIAATPPITTNSTSFAISTSRIRSGLASLALRQPAWLH